jgi:hypothetical protein
MLILPALGIPRDGGHNLSFADIPLMEGWMTVVWIAALIESRRALHHGTVVACCVVLY